MKWKCDNYIILFAIVLKLLIDCLCAINHFHSELDKIIRKPIIIDKSHFLLLIIFITIKRLTNFSVNLFLNGYINHF